MIRKSSAREVEGLLRDLESTDDVRIETAIARLSIAGSRAAPHLLEYLKRTASAPAMAAALRALEGSGDTVALRQALAYLDADQPLVARAAVGVARALLAAAPSSLALDRLTAVTVDRRRPDSVRLSALDALADLPARTLKPLLKDLQLDESLAIREQAAKLAGGKGRPPSLSTVMQASLGDLPNSPESLSPAIEEAGLVVPLSAMHRLLEAVKEREGRIRGAESRRRWTQLRGTIHEQLAARESRIGLYDLRESFGAAGRPLPPQFLKAIARIGNAEALESVAAAYQRAAEAGLSSWRTALLETFQAIVRRERLTRRSPALKRALRKSRALAELWRT